jgi:DtxR family Mn-dependent transcriptional regulator
MSDAVERKLLGLLGHPTVSPFGNPIPGLEALRDDAPHRPAEAAESGRPAVLATTATPEGRRVVVRRISEQLQEDGDTLRVLDAMGVRPGTTAVARLVEGGVTLDDRSLPPGVAQHLFVTAEERSPA